MAIMRLPNGSTQHDYSQDLAQPIGGSWNAGAHGISDYGPQSVEAPHWYADQLKQQQIELAAQQVREAELKNDALMMANRDTYPWHAEKDGAPVAMPPIQMTVGAAAPSLSSPTPTWHDTAPAPVQGFGDLEFKRSLNPDSLAASKINAYDTPEDKRWRDDQRLAARPYDEMIRAIGQDIELSPDEKKQRIEEVMQKRSAALGHSGSAAPTPTPGPTVNPLPAAGGIPRAAQQTTGTLPSSITPAAPTPSPTPMPVAGGVTTGTAESVEELAKRDPRELTLEQLKLVIAARKGAAR